MIGEPIRPQPKPTPRLSKSKKRPTPITGEQGSILTARAACSRLAKSRANGRCEVCGGRGTEAAHIFGKGAFPHIQFYGPNLLWACEECHRVKGHGNPVWWRRQAERILGWRQYADLCVAANSHPADDWRDVLAAAKQGRFLVEREVA